MAMNKVYEDNNKRKLMLHKSYKKAVNMSEKDIVQKNKEETIEDNKDTKTTTKNSKKD